MSETGGGERFWDGVGPSATLTSPTWGRTLYRVEEIESLRPSGTGEPSPWESNARVAIGAASTFVLVVVLGLIMSALVPKLFGYGSTAVVSGSMEPLIGVGDVVVTRNAEGVALQSGQVIDYRFDGGRRLHRIVAELDDGYQTAGDANEFPDSTPVTRGQIEGVGHMLVPYVGLPQVWLSDRQWFHLGATIVALTLAAWTARPRWMTVEVVS